MLHLRCALHVTLARNLLAWLWILAALHGHDGQIRVRVSLLGEVTLTCNAEAKLLSCIGLNPAPRLGDGLGLVLR